MVRIPRTVLVLSLTALCALPATAAGPPLVEQAVLVPPGAPLAARMGLGAAISRNGRILLGGAVRTDCPDGPSCGAAFPYAGGGSIWGSEGSLAAFDALQGDELGRAVSLSADGSVALVGAPNAKCGASFNCGAAYVFLRSNTGTWSPAAKLAAPDAAAGNHFGFAVALSADGQNALIGAPDQGCLAGASCGTAYRFSGSGASWIFLDQLAPLDVTANGMFGAAVALSADATTELVGKPADSCGAGFGCGAAYLFMGNTQVHKLAASDPQANSDFGWSVALSLDGAYALAGRPYFDCGAGADCGTAHVFTRAASWAEVARLTSVPDVPGSLFGFAGAVNDGATTALFGAPGLACGGATSFCGGAYLFTNSAGTWSQSQKLTATVPVDSSSLGIAVGLSNDGQTAVAGANFAGCPAPSAATPCGALHIFAPLSILAVPALGPAGLAGLMLALGVAAVVLLRRQARLRTYDLKT